MISNWPIHGPKPKKQSPPAEKQQLAESQQKSGKTQPRAASSRFPPARHLKAGESLLSTKIR
jgi:hypothetical protein